MKIVRYLSIYMKHCTLLFFLNLFTYFFYLKTPQVPVLFSHHCISDQHQNPEKSSLRRVSPQEARRAIKRRMGKARMTQTVKRNVGSMLLSPAN